MEDTKRNEIIAGLWRDRDQIFGKIDPQNLGQYNRTQTDLRETNVATDQKYQADYTKFYVVRWRSPAWRTNYYELLQREKFNEFLTFDAVLTELFEYDGRVETSFSSKIVATVRPDMPVYDKYVRKKLNIRVPKGTPEVRLAKAKRAYQEIEHFFAAALQSDTVHDLRVVFDSRFACFKHFTATKKLDLLLWQSRVR